MKKQNKTNTKKVTVKKSKSKIINIVLFILVLFLSFTIYFILIEKENIIKKNEMAKSIIKKEKEKIEKYTKELYKEYVEIKQEKKIPNIKNNKEKKKIQKEIKKNIIKKPRITKAKLAIIIDDVTTQTQVNRILNLGYRVNISFLPPTKKHKNSAKIAQKLPFHIVHLPLEANSFLGNEENTLKVTHSYEIIEKRIKQIRKWYPNAKYTNNHTGSKFTSDDKSMNKLMKALKKYNFIFLDSRTSSKTLGKKYSKKYNMPYLARNVFLDNEVNSKAIKKQFKKVIYIAKKQGYAIAIAHPHLITLKTIEKYKYLLKDLDLVYINKIPTK